MKKAMNILLIISIVSAVLLILASIVVIVLQKPICNMMSGMETENFILPVPIVIRNLLTIFFFTISVILTYQGIKKEEKISYELIAMIIYFLGVFIIALAVCISSPIYINYLNVKYGNYSMITYSNINTVINSIEAYTPFSVCKLFLVIAQALSIGRKLGKKENK